MMDGDDEADWPVSKFNQVRYGLKRKHEERTWAEQTLNGQIFCT